MGLLVRGCDPLHARLRGDCLRFGGWWVHPRECPIRGHVGCCDSSPDRRATKPSGVVESAGENVTDLREGDEVYVYNGGCYAEYLAAPARKAARKPASLSFEEAAGVPVAGSTAYQGIVEEIGLKEGEDRRGLPAVTPQPDCKARGRSLA